MALLMKGAMTKNAKRQFAQLYNIWLCTRLFGVLLFVKNSVVSAECHELNKLRNESIWCEINVSSGCPIFVGVVYKSTSAVSEEIDGILSMLRSLSGKHVVVMGDFNYPNIDWNTFDSDAVGGAFIDVILGNFWTQHVLSPTREGNILDLVLSTEEGMIENITVDEHLANSDHNIVCFNLVAETKIDYVNQTRYDYKKVIIANYEIYYKR